MGLSDKKSKFRTIKHGTAAHYTTVYDDVYREVQIRPQAIEQLAATLKITNQKVEQLVRVLEKDKLVVTEYPVIGKPIVRIPGSKAQPITLKRDHKWRNLTLFALGLILLCSFLLYFYLRGGQ